MLTTTKLSYSDRAEHCHNATARALLSLMDEKNSNLAVAADVTTKGELLALADIVGSEICILKTHIDIVEDFDNDLITQLQRLAKQHHFLIFEDRKFADIGNTVKHQYRGGIYNIASWADIANAHTLPGPGIVEGLKEVGLPLQRGLLLLAQMSSKGTLTGEEYVKATVDIAKQHADFVMGFICQEKISDDPGMIHCTPGVNLAEEGDSLGQKYNTPEYVIGEKGSDVIIVGRGITGASDARAAARRYRVAGWSAYASR